MLCDVVRRRRRRWAYAPVMHAASHFDHKKRVTWVPISMHTCGSFFYNYGAPLGGRSSAINEIKRKMETKMKTLIKMQKQMKMKTKVAEPPRTP